MSSSFEKFISFISYFYEVKLTFSLNIFMRIARGLISTSRKSLDKKTKTDLYTFMGV